MVSLGEDADGWVGLAGKAGDRRKRDVDDYSPFHFLIRCNWSRGVSVSLTYSMQKSDIQRTGIELQRYWLIVRLLYQFGMFFVCTRTSSHF